jgi:PAS domain S-box-containing protein
MIAVFQVSDAALPLFIGSPVPGFGATIVLDGVTFGALAAPAPDTAGGEHVRRARRVMHGMSTRIVMWPLPGTADRLRSRVPQAIAVAGALITALLGLVTMLAGAARERARLAQATQRDAEASQREIAELLEGLPDAFFAYDREWRFTHLNRAAEELVGRPRALVVGRVLWDTSATARGDFGAAYERSMTQRTVERFEVHYAQFGIWLSIQSFPLPNGIGVVARNVTGEYRTLEALRRREADLAQALEFADLARLEMDATERVVWSGAATKVLGCAEEDLPADRAAMRRMWHPEDAAAQLAATSEGIRSGRGFDVKHRIVRPDGSVRWVHTVARVFADGPAAPRVVATVQDITELRLQARAVLERDRFFDGSRDLFCIIASDGKVLQANPAFCRLFGYSRDELIGRPVFDFTHPDDLDYEQTRFRDALGGAPPEPAQRPARALARDGQVRWIHWSSSLSPEGDLYAVGHDVTERIASEAGRERTLAELRARNDELQQFAYIASHDLQEPLRKIQAFSDRLAGRYSTQLGTDGRDYLSRMDNAAKRMSTLIADLLDYSRVATQGEPFLPVSLDDVLDDVLGDLEEAIRASGAEVRREPLPVIEADRTQLAQVFQNLLGNAVKYRQPARTPRVQLRAERFTLADADGRGAATPWVRVVVEDNGIGFDPAHEERIFAPFQRLHGRAEFAGTGIGLAIVRKIVERHGGRVRAQGRPGEGATFVVELPERRPPAAAPTA